MAATNSPMCLSALYFMNLRGEVLMERQYRDDVTCVACPARTHLHICI